ncbi:MAG TPA: IPT/TIG domain-containing protein [Vicinamibacterales bacterium]|nr:IPT/TIG domain-containing protein [Vicinamibacterales bacterium]
MTRQAVLIATLLGAATCGHEQPVQPSTRLTVTAISPAAATPQGTVFVSGTGFQSGAQVTLDGVAATNVQVFGSTTISAVSPAHAAGAVDVVVTNPDGERAVLARGFTFTSLPPPTVTSFGANSGLTSGGGDIRIRGTGFQAGAIIAFDGRPALLQFGIQSTMIVVSAPAHQAGQVDVVITLPDGQSVSVGDAFTYVQPSFSDFNGDWTGSDGIETDGDFLSFTIRDNLLRRVACRGTEIVFATPPSTDGGLFTAVVDGAVVFTGGLVSANSATGTINIGACTNKGWFAAR